jgi:DegV family protein with EDD domain
MTTVRIVADTTSGLPRDVTELLDIKILPQIVIFGEKSYRDDTELDTATFLKLLREARQLPQTSAPPPALYEPIFKRALDHNETVIVVTPSEKVSGTYRSAMIAKESFPSVDIHVVDSNSIAGNLGSMVMLAASLAREGRDPDNIVATIQSMSEYGRTYFVLDTLNYLQKGGRIGGAKALLGEILQVKPILQLRNGRVEAFDQERTKKKAIEKMVSLVAEQVQGSGEPHLCVMEADAREEAESIKATLQSRTGIVNIPIYQLPPAIVVHAGPKTLAVGFFAGRLV